VPLAKPIADEFQAWGQAVDRYFKSKAGSTEIKAMATSVGQFASLQLADIDHACYTDHALTLARHPSETDERMMVRLVALALNAHALPDDCGGDGQLAFGAGLSDPDEPDVWLRDFTGRTRLWIEVGQPEDKPVAKACSKADRVRLYCFSHAADIWWRGMEGKLARLQNLEVFRLPTESVVELGRLAQRSMQLQATVQEGVLTLGDTQRSVDIEPIRWK
jgi:uncharacterized protein YaeQ